MYNQTLAGLRGGENGVGGGGGGGKNARVASDLGEKGTKGKKEAFGENSRGNSERNDCRSKGESKTGDGRWADGGRKRKK